MAVNSVSPPLNSPISFSPTISRPWVDAPTAVYQGAPFSVVYASGPLLPAETAANMPASCKAKKATSVEFDQGSPPPLIEKLITSTPSAIASSNAAKIAALGHPE